MLPENSVLVIEPSVRSRKPEIWVLLDPALLLLVPLADGFIGLIDFFLLPSMLYSCYSRL